MFKSRRYLLKPRLSMIKEWVTRTFRAQKFLQR